MNRGDTHDALHPARMNRGDTHDAGCHGHPEYPELTVRVITDWASAHLRAR